MARSVAAGLGDRLVVRPDHLGDLPADLVQRVQAGQRVLEDHGDLARRGSCCSWSGGQAEQVGAVEHGLAGDLAARGQPEQGLGQHGLAADPDSPTMPSVRPGSTLNETPRTACTTPSAVGKLTRRSVTSSRLISSSRKMPARMAHRDRGDFLMRGFCRRVRLLAAKSQVNRVDQVRPVPAGRACTQSPAGTVSELAVLQIDVGQVRTADVRRPDDRGAA